LHCEPIQAIRRHTCFSLRTPRVGTGLEISEFVDIYQTHFLSSRHSQVVLFIRNMRVATFALLQYLVAPTNGFNIAPSGQHHRIVNGLPVVLGRPCLTKVRSTIVVITDGPIEPEDDDEDGSEDESLDPYLEAAPSEFMEEPKDDGSSSALSFQGGEIGRSNLDWGGEYGKLAERIEDIETGMSQSPSKALFRIMTSESPNQAISNFLKTANPQVVGAMSGAVSSLLGGLSRPSTGIETIVKTTGDKIGNLCFQLQMTGYMFRNAEYVMALKDLMKLTGGATLEDYKEAFDRLDRDKSGFIDTEEIEALLADVYGDNVPGFEIDSFMKFFDSNRDGRISWQEFERGLGNISQKEAENAVSKNMSFLIPGSDDDDEDDLPEVQPIISGRIEIELENGQMIEVEANEYIASLKKEAEVLKEALRQELAPSQQSQLGITPMGGGNSASPSPMGDGIASYIASRKDDLQTLTESVQPEIMDTMKMLVDFVLQGGTGRKKPEISREKMEMELPGSALQQLALWQLVLGYKLREAEATGDYLKLLE